ncbi:MAG: hypothetical protein HYX60_02715 [Legionella longbeachae]|nr:hypothetical protein [Legionella longbeachae]
MGQSFSQDKDFENKDINRKKSSSNIQKPPEINFKLELLASPSNLYNEIDHMMDQCLNLNKDNKDFGIYLNFIKDWLYVNYYAYINDTEPDQFKSNWVNYSQMERAQECFEQMDYTDQMLFLNKVVDHLAKNTKYHAFIQLSEFLNEKLIPDSNAYENLFSDNENRYFFCLNDHLLKVLSTFGPKSISTKENEFLPLQSTIKKVREIIMQEGIHGLIHERILFHIRENSEVSSSFKRHRTDDSLTHLLNILTLDCDSWRGSNLGFVPLEMLCDYFQTIIQPQEWVKEIWVTENQEVHRNDQQNLPVDHNLNDPNLIIENNNHEDLSSTEDNDEVPDIPPFILDPNNGNIILLDNPPHPEQPKQPSPLIEQSLFSKVQPDIKDIQKKKNPDQRFQALVTWFDENEPFFDNDSEFQKSKEKLNKFEEKYKCSISDTIMEDPVMIESGFCYGRLAIKQWFNNNNTCPQSRKICDPNILITPVGMLDKIKTGLENLEKKQNTLANRLQDQLSKKAF